MAPSHKTTRPHINVEQMTAHLPRDIVSGIFRNTIPRQNQAIFDNIIEKPFAQEFYDTMKIDGAKPHKVSPTTQQDSSYISLYDADKAAPRNYIDIDLIKEKDGTLLIEIDRLAFYQEGYKKIEYKSLTKLIYEDTTRKWNMQHNYPRTDDGTAVNINGISSLQPQDIIFLVFYDTFQKLFDGIQKNRTFLESYALPVVRFVDAVLYGRVKLDDIVRVTKRRASHNTNNNSEQPTPKPTRVRMDNIIKASLMTLSQKRMRSDIRRGVYNTNALFYPNENHTVHSRMSPYRER